MQTPLPNKSHVRIGDLARWLDVDTHVIRFWQDEFKAFTRVFRSRSGQRWYSREQCELFREIQRLLHTELYTIEGAKRQLRLRRQGDHVPELVEERRAG